MQDGHRKLEYEGRIRKAELTECLGSGLQVGVDRHRLKTPPYLMEPSILDSPRRHFLRKEISQNGSGDRRAEPVPR